MSTRVWLGAAIPIAQVSTITVADTWTAGDTLTVKINNKSLILTVGATVTVAAIATAVKEMINGSSITGNATRNATGNTIGEFSRITATDDGAGVVTLTADDAGIPFTVTTSVNVASDGTATVATPTAASGPWHFDTASNWSGATVPVDGDTIIFDHRAAASCKYNIDQSSLTPAAVYVTLGFTYDIGLPTINENDSALPYDEYRQRYLKICDSGDSATTTVKIGDGDGQGSGRILIDTNTGQTTLTVFATGNRSDAGVPAFVWKGSHASNVANFLKGDIGVAFSPDDTATIATMRIGSQGSKEADVSLFCGAGLTLTTLSKDGGNAEINSAATTITHNSGTLVINGSGAVTTLKIRGGTVNYNSTGTLGTGTVSGSGHLDYSQDLQAKAITNPFEIYGENAKFSDPFQVVASLILDLNETANSANINIGTNIRLTRGTPA